MSDSEGLIEQHVIAYYELQSRGEAPELSEFLARVPSALREECERRIENGLRLRDYLEELQPSASEVHTVSADAIEALPSVPGFRLERQIGHGGLGTVYLAQDETLMRNVALKILRRGTRQQVKDRILSEARKAASLEHPGIVTVHSVVSEGDAPAIVMEFVEGFPIDRATAGVDARKKAAIFRTLARALASAHRAGLIHRDLKPDNILLTPSLEPKILDFGLAAKMEVESGPRNPFQGTPLYCSPEQAACEQATPASDVFSLGAVLFKVLTGRPPFSGESVPEVLHQMQAGSPPFPRQLVSGIPEELQAICLACLSKDPKERPSAEEVARDLERFLAREAIQLRPALYGDLLRRTVAKHGDELSRFEDQGMISSRERDRLQSVYQRILDDEDHWILDARKLSLTQLLITLGTWVTVVSALFSVWLIRDEISAQMRWSAPVTASLLLIGFGTYAQIRREVVAAASLLAGAVLSIAPSLLSMLAELDLLSTRDRDVTQLLAEPFSNRQVFASALGAFVLSACCQWRLRMTGFAWTTATLAVMTYLAALIQLGWLDRDLDLQALWCLPLISLETVALWFESRGRIRWSIPFHLIALSTLVAVLDLLALSGPTLSLLGLEPLAEVEGGSPVFLNETRLQTFSLALNGVFFVFLTVGIERASSLHLRRAARFLEAIAPFHLLTALYLNAQKIGVSDFVWVDLSLYFAAVLGLLLLSPWRCRRGFLFSGLGGVALGSHLLLDLELVAPAPFVLCLGVSGIALALGTFVLRRRP